MIPQKLRTGASSDAAAGASEILQPVQSGLRIPGSPTALRRETTVRSFKDGRDKKKGVSFLSRFIGGKKKESSPLLPDHESEVPDKDNRTEGMDADVFSQPIGFIPRFPAPPKYIKVRVHNRKEKDFDRVFLAQEIQGNAPRKVAKENRTPTAASNQNTATPVKNNSAIWAMEFSKDGKYLAAGGQDKVVRVWAVLSSPEDRVVHETEEDAKDGDGPAVRLNAPVFKSHPVQEYEGHTASVLDLSWSKNNFLLSSSMDKTVRLWHVSRVECLCCFKHSDFVTSIQFHPRDDRFFLAGSLDSKLRLWSIPDKSVAYWTQVPDMVTAVTFAPDGKTAVAGCLNGLCMFYETEGLKPYTQIHVRSARGKNARGSKITGMDTITLPPDDPNGVVKLLVTSNDSRVRLYNFRDRNLEIKFRGNENTCSQIHATFSDDGRYVICGSEDRKAYIWPTAYVDKEQDKRPLEVFEAHSAIVTTAILAPTKTRQLLGLSGDPLYDLCNPPPVTLVERSGSLPSSRPTTDGGALPQEGAVPPPTPQPAEPAKRSKAGESPGYLARSSHVNGNIIVTADYTGTIKVFRQDCAYQKRRHESWDSGSAISKKFLGRTGSVAARSSMSSVSKPDSLSKHPSADRILSWRQSITSGQNGSLDSLRNGHGSRTRSLSPRKSMGQMSHQSSPQHTSTPLQSINTPSVTTTSPPPSIHHAPTAAAPQPLKARSENHAANNAPKGDQPGHYVALPITKDDPLMLQGDQSYMYWNRAEFSAQAATIPRTPAVEPGAYLSLSRNRSVASTLSSEVSSIEGKSADNGASDGDDLKCRACGSLSFRAKGRAGEQKLVCNNCGTLAT